MNEFIDDFGNEISLYSDEYFHQYLVSRSTYGYFNAEEYYWWNTSVQII